MPNSEKPHPEYFEELCSLAASGLISEPEFIELRDHMQDCAKCRSGYAEFVDLLHNKLPLAAPEIVAPSRLAEFFSGKSLYRARFLSRARKQGLAIPSESFRGACGSRPTIWLLGEAGHSPLLALAIAVLVTTAAVLSYNLRQSNTRYRNLAAEMIAMSRQIEHRDRPASILPQENGTSVLGLKREPPPPPSIPPKTVDELAGVRRELAAAEARAKVLQEQQQATSSELQAARIQISDAIDARSQLETKLTESDQTIARVNRELQAVRESRSKDSAAIVAQGLRIQELSEKLSAQTESLERERSLLAAGRDIHELMGARNLHIVDVSDIDSKGKDSRTFGRVFYTEGKSLIFYAFDLGDRSTIKRNASFQVWGSRGPGQSPAQNLGIFYVDDQKQNRWVLKFEDPRILAEIDSVFVTVEPPGGSTKPTGHKLLYAYLGADPNHP